MKLLKVKRPHSTVWHYALDSEIRPVCACGCLSPAGQRKRGDGLCLCFCHGLGPRKALSLCGKLAVKKARIRLANGDQAALDFYRQIVPTQMQLSISVKVVETSLIKPRPWSVVVGRDPGCQTCGVLGIKLTRGDLSWLLERIEQKVGNVHDTESAP